MSDEAGAAWQPDPPAPRPEAPPAASGRGSAIKRGEWEMRQLIHPVSAEDLRALPEVAGG